MEFCIKSNIFIKHNSENLIIQESQEVRNPLRMHRRKEETKWSFLANIFLGVFLYIIMSLRIYTFENIETLFIWINRNNQRCQITLVQSLENFKCSFHCWISLTPNDSKQHFILTQGYAMINTKINQTPLINQNYMLSS